VVLPASRILSGLLELFATEPAIADRSSAMVMVTGPSRTADIELSRSGDPALRSLDAVLASLGLRISVQPKASRRSRGRWRPVPARIGAPSRTGSRA